MITEQDGVVCNGTVTQYTCVVSMLGLYSEVTSSNIGQNFGFPGRFFGVFPYFLEENVEIIPRLEHKPLFPNCF